MVFPNYPKTVNSVQEILDLADKYQIPLSRCRFFINQDIQEPRAFGIYNDGINWIVYKNKANGERAIRYQGKDEAYAAQEIWSKFLSEVDARRSNGSSSGPSKTKKDPGNFIVFIFAAWFVLCAGLGVSSRYEADAIRGYYSYGKQIYYRQQDTWYRLDDDGEWDCYYGDYSGFSKCEYTGEYYFEDSDYYEEYSYSSSSSSSSDWDTDWDDWDSSDTDWDSDW